MSRTRKATPHFSKRSIGIAVAVGLTAVPLAVLGYKYYSHSLDKLEAALIHVGFYPISPPSKLVIPGSIYHVTRDGRQYTTICEADKADTELVERVSEAPEVVSSELLTGRFEFAVDPAGDVNSHLKGNVVSSVQYSLRDVFLREIALDRNAEISAKLTERPSCKAEVHKLLQGGEFVCQGQAILLANVQYRLNTAGEAGGNLEGSALLSALQGALSTSVAIVEGQFVSGLGLHYGVRVNPDCMTLRNGEPRRLPPLRMAAAFF